MVNDNYIEAKFIIRLNRFVGIVDIDGNHCSVYIPNTGRLSELLHPGRRVMLIPSSGKHPYRLQYVIYKDKPIFIDSITSNRIFYDLLTEKRVPMQGDYDSITREPCFRDHRFDFSLSENLSGDRDKLFIELKSVTLAWDNTASFPDAPTIRGVEHIRALSHSGKGMLVFLIFHSNIDYFIPNYHTDFEFYKTLVDHKENIQISAFSVEYGVNLDINGLKEVEIILPHVKPSGSYLLIYSNSSCRIADVGHLGGISFPEGFYIYVGSGKKNLFKRIEYHRRNSVKKHWHVDYIKNHFKLIMDIPIVTHRDIECILAERIIELGGKGIKGFGSSDCRCNSHFFFFASNPLYSEDFWDMILEERLSIL